MALKWVSDFFADVDTVRIDRLEGWFADDIDLRFSNNPAVIGKQPALDVLRDFYTTITGMRHEPLAIVGSGNEAAQQAIVTYTRPDGRDVPLPVSSYLRQTTDGRIDRLWIYIDIAPLFAEGAA